MSRIPFILDPGKKTPKTIEKIKKKNSFLHYFFPKRDDIGRVRYKQNLVPNSIHSRPGDKNSEKNCKKIQKIKKPISGIISIQNGLRQAGKERKKI